MDNQAQLEQLRKQVQSTNKKLSIVAKYLQSEDGKKSFHDFIKNDKEALDIFDYEYLKFCGVCSLSADGTEQKNCNYESAIYYFNALTESWDTATANMDGIYNDLYADGKLSEKNRSIAKEQKLKQLQQVGSYAEQRVKNPVFKKLYRKHQPSKYFKDLIGKIKLAKSKGEDYHSILGWDENYYYAVGDNYYALTKELIPKLESLDVQIQVAEKKANILQDNANTIAKDGSKINALPITQQSWTQKALTTGRQAINKWIPIVQGWQPEDVKKQVNGALWQIWIKDQVELFGFNKSYVKNDFERFYHTLGQSGILNELDNGFQYTNLDKINRLAELEEAKVVPLENEYELYQAQAQKIADKSWLSGLRYDIFKSNQERKNKRLGRITERKDKQLARDQIQSAIWNLEKKHNPKERDYKAKYESGLREMEAISKLASEQQKQMQVKFEQALSKTETNEKLLADIHAIIDPLEAKVQDLAVKYDLERLLKSYNRSKARQDYRASKKALKESYKDLYGKGWRTSNEYKSDKAEIIYDRDTALEENKSFFGKTFDLLQRQFMFQVPMSAFEGLIASNAFDLAGRMARVRDEKPNDYKKIVNIYRRYSGTEKRLNKLIDNAKDRTPKPKYGSKLGKLIYKTGVAPSELSSSFDGNTEVDYYHYATGVDDAVALITASTPIVVPIGTVIVQALKEQGITGDPEVDKEIIENELDIIYGMIDDMDELSDEQKNDAKYYVSQGYSLDEALEMVGATPNNNWLWYLGGGLVLLGGTYVAIKILKKNKKSKK